MIVPFHRYVVDFVLLESILPSYQVGGLCDHRRRSARRQDDYSEDLACPQMSSRINFFLNNKSEIPPTISILKKHKINKLILLF